MAGVKLDTTSSSVRGPDLRLTGADGTCGAWDREDEPRGRCPGVRMNLPEDQQFKIRCYRGSPCRVGMTEMAEGKHRWQAWREARSTHMDPRELRVAETSRAAGSSVRCPGHVGKALGPGSHPPTRSSRWASCISQALTHRHACPVLAPNFWNSVPTV